MPKKTFKATILMIEDERFLVDMYQMKFENEGYKVIPAYNGLPGFELAKKKKPNLILLDIVMPKTDGYIILKKLKNEPKTKDIPVLIFSNLGQKEEIDKGLGLGAVDYVIKSNLTPTGLVAKAEEILKAEAEKSESKVKTKKKITPKVLLIEDNIAIIDIYQTRLEKEGYEVEVAKNGAWGLRLAKEKPYDIILMDIVMPALDGCTAIKKLKKNSKTKKIPIIVLSNSAQDKDIKEALDCGAEAYFLKSKITPQEIVQKVEKILKK